MFLIEQTHFLISSRVYFLFSLLFHYCFFRRNFSVPVNEINLNEFFEIKILRDGGFWIEGCIVTSIISSDLYAGFYGYFSDLADTFGEVSQNE